MPLYSNRNAIKQMSKPSISQSTFFFQVNKWKKWATSVFLSFWGYSGKSVHGIFTSFDPASSMDNWRVSKPREGAAFQVQEVLGEAGQHLVSQYNYSPKESWVHSINPIGLHLRWKLSISWRPGTGKILGLVIIMFFCMPDHIFSKRYKWNIYLHAPRWPYWEKSTQIYSGRIILTTLSKKKWLFSDQLCISLWRIKGLTKEHMRKKWGHISFEVQKQCVLKVMFEAVIVAACVSPQMKPECRGVSIKICLQSPLYWRVPL